MLAVISSEWLKLRSVRSTAFALGVVAAGMLAGVLMAWQVASIWDGLPPGRRGEVKAVSLEVVTVMATQLCMAVLGVLAITSEYASGTIRTSLTVMPRRRLVLAAKALVVAVVTLVIGQASTFATFLVARSIVGDRPIPPGYTTPAADAVPLLAASGLSVMVFALVGLGLGTVLRSTAGAITTIAGLWYVLPMVALNLPEPWNDRIFSVLLPSLPDQLAGASSMAFDPVLSPLGALAVTVAYVVVTLGAATMAITRRDA
jgi:ABC-2 type transport system permease protein